MMLFDLESVGVMWLLLVPAIGLTLFETREQKLDLVTTLWWVLLVLLIHVVGYLAIRLWSTSKRSQENQA